MKKVLTFGTFDVLHPGHISYLTQAQNLADELHICVARDVTVKHIKNITPRQTEDERIFEIQSYFPDAVVYLGDTVDHMKIIDDVKPDIIALGYDQRSFTDQLEKYITDNTLSIEIVRLQSFYPDMYKSSRFRNDNMKQKNMHGGFDAL